MAREWRKHTRMVAEEVARLRGEQSDDAPPARGTIGRRVSDQEFFSMTGIGEA